VTAKPPTPQGISALLRKAGFQRYVNSVSEYRDGYRVSAGRTRFERGVVVEHVAFCTSIHMRDTCHAEMLAKYAEGIAAAGWHLGGLTRDGRRLIVTAREDSQ
jgi:hypothetical protein